MTVHRLNDPLTPFEKFRAKHPLEADKLKASIMQLTGCSDASAGFVMQECLNALWRTGQRVAGQTV
ncbi:hypothetical protein [Aureimonas altamirensis]|uniref:hypothetical protein n=1 Tax=Aureimonas altamirensis TaxID=370622 RepID=UPI0025542E70|nr:hypothetical protein [Aureimonas altamirensis]